MDKTETYIKMCDKAEEIQLLSPENFVEEAITMSWYYLPQHNDIYLTPSGNYVGVLRNRRILTFVWLPLQAQLRDMITKEYLIFRDDSTSPYRVFISTEQCWLAFVMKDIYNKYWNGDKWKKQCQTAPISV